MLIVRDNFEQVVSAGPHIAELLRRCPRATFLVTSRSALRVSGEQEYPVGGLPAPPDPERLSEVERLNLGEFVHYQCPDGAVYEIRLLSVEGFDTATLLVTRIK